MYETSLDNIIAIISLEIIDAAAAVTWSLCHILDLFFITAALNRFTVRCVYSQSQQ